jgi:hypothetical protein
VLCLVVVVVVVEVEVEVACGGVLVVDVDVTRRRRISRVSSLRIRESLVSDMGVSQRLVAWTSDGQLGVRCCDVEEGRSATELCNSPTERPLANTQRYGSVYCWCGWLSEVACLAVVVVVASNSRSDSGCWYYTRLTTLTHSLSLSLIGQALHSTWHSHQQEAHPRCLV